MSLALAAILRELFFKLLLVLVRVVHNESAHLEIEFIDTHNLLYSFLLVVKDWLSYNVLVPLEALNLKFLSESRVFVLDLEELRFPDCLTVHVEEDLVEEFGPFLKHNRIVSDAGTR